MLLQVFCSCFLVSIYFSSTTKACYFRLTNSQGTFAPSLYPQVNVDITFCTWELEAPVGEVVEITFEEVRMNSTDENDVCFDRITVFDGPPPFSPEIIPPFCGDGPGWPRYPTQLLSQSNIMTVTMKKELEGSTGFLASYKHVQPREEFVAVLSVENPSIVLFNRFSSTNSRIYLIGASHPSALSFDQINNIFYFTDIQNQFIGRISLVNSGAVEKLITDNVRNPLGVAVAYLTGLLYWTDAGRHEVSVSRLDGTFRKTLMNSSMSCRTPMGIVLSRDQQYIFWTCESRIVKSKSDGSEQNFDFVSTDVVNPTALAIDSDGIYLYWMDTHVGVVDRIRVDGIGRVNVLSSSERFFEDLHSFAISDFAYYWTHPDDQRVLYYSRHGEGTTRYVSLRQKQTFGGLFYYNSDLLIPEQHICLTESGGCEGLCFPDGNSVKCDDTNGVPSSSPITESPHSSTLAPSHASMVSTASVLSKVTEFPHSSTTPDNSNDELYFSPLVYAVIALVTLVCLASGTAIVAVLCCCGCCRCDCPIKEKSPSKEPPLPMQAQPPKWRANNDDFSGMPNSPYYMGNLHPSEYDGEYITLG